MAKSDLVMWGMPMYRIYAISPIISIDVMPAQKYTIDLRITDCVVCFILFVAPFSDHENHINKKYKEEQDYRRCNKRFTVEPCSITHFKNNICSESSDRSEERRVGKECRSRWS